MMQTNERKILIVGDGSSEITAIREGLVADGCRVRLSGTAEAALAASQEWHPEVVIADDTFAEFIQHLRRLCIDIPVLVRSRSRAAFVELLNSGADDCVDKSCSVAELRARIRSKLRNSRRFVPTETKREG